MRIAIIAMLALVCAASDAEARQRHRATTCIETGTVLHPVCGMSQFSASFDAEKRDKAGRKEAARRARGQQLYDAMPFGVPTSSAAEGARFIRGRLVCALNVGAELARRGIRGTGSALAKSYLSWGHASTPRPGAVAVFSRGRRGGHVAIVHSVRPDGTVIYLNPSSRRQAWQIGPYHKRPIAFRVPG
ncbi:MAG: CHAP domain-containing protein [Rhizobiales bacterium]|nr:CHAP domain-containing protein [Hyphomicrobiales bacterium]